MHGHSSDSTNAVIQFIQMEKCPKNFTKWAISRGDIYLCVPQPKCWRGRVPPAPYNRRPWQKQNYKFSAFQFYMAVIIPPLAVTSLK